MEDTGSGKGHRDIVVIGASAGGIQMLTQLFADLPAGLEASFFVVLHVPADSPSLLPGILARASSGRFAVAHAIDGEPIERGRVYVAPPNRHLVLHRDRVHVARGPRENGHRPAIDPLFRSAARVYRNRTIGVVLSGSLDDGSAGLQLVKRCGGICLVQDPHEAPYPEMPWSAILAAEPQHVLPVRAIGGKIAELVAEAIVPLPAEAVEKTPGSLDKNEAGREPLEATRLRGAPTPFTCPECGGALWELQHGKLVRFECHVGHGFSPQSLSEEKEASLEIALWTALRILDEKAALARRLLDRARERGFHLAVPRFETEAREAERAAGELRRLLVRDWRSERPRQEADTSGESLDNPPALE